jgi:hypothetical protein
MISLLLFAFIAHSPRVNPALPAVRNRTPHVHVHQHGKGRKI